MSLKSSKIEVAEDALLIGRLYYNGRELFLLTDDLYVIKVEDELLKDLSGHRILLRGS